MPETKACFICGSTDECSHRETGLVSAIETSIRVKQLLPTQFPPSLLVGALPGTEDFKLLQKLARKELIKAIKNRRLKRPKKCFQCGKPCNPIGHQQDYTRPLEVTWVCHKCGSKLRKTPTENHPVKKSPVSTCGQFRKTLVKRRSGGKVGGSEQGR